MKGKMIGEWKWYRENGKLMQVGSLDNDIKTGVWKRYRVDGTLMDETIFINGKKKESQKVLDQQEDNAPKARLHPMAARFLLSLSSSFFTVDIFR